jgi:hypothetical protein
MMTKAQMRLFLYEAMRGDGTTDGQWPTKEKQIGRTRELGLGGTAWRLALADQGQVNAVQHMAFLCGLRTTVADKGSYLLVTIWARAGRAQVDKMQRLEFEAPWVWCPTTETGFWVARRNGTIFLTGNSHPGDAMGYGAAILFPLGRWGKKRAGAALPPEPSYYGRRRPDPLLKGYRTL